MTRLRQYHVSVSREMHAKITAVAKRRGVPARQVVDLACEDLEPEPPPDAQGSPVSGVCAVCTSFSASMQMRPLGRADAFVAVCPRCDGEHPRSGRYNFTGAVKHEVGTGLNALSGMGSSRRVPGRQGA